MRPTLLISFVVFLGVLNTGCTVDEGGQGRQQFTAAQDSQKEADERETKGNTAPNNFTTIEKIPVSGTKIFVVCFYGEDDHDNIARNMCTQKYNECIAAYGARSCERIVNPNREALERIRNEGMVIVVTHTTPDPDTECKTGVGIWDAGPGITPSVVSECIDAPIIWFGCYSYGISQQCSNVIPMADKPEILDSREPIVVCRFRASSACIAELIRSGQSFTQEDVQACVERKMAQMCPNL